MPGRPEVEHDDVGVAWAATSRPASPVVAVSTS